MGGDGLAFRIDVDGEGSESLSLSGGRGDGESVGVGSIDGRGKVGGSSSVASSSKGASVADAPLDVVRETVQRGEGGVKRRDGDDSEPPVGGSRGSSGGVASPDAGNAALSEERRVGTSGDGSRSFNSSQATVVVETISTSSRGSTSRLRSSDSSNSDVSRVVGGQRDGPEALLVDAVSNLFGGGRLTGRVRAAGSRASGGLGPEVDVEGNRSADVVANVVEEDLDDISVLSIVEDDVIETDELNPSVGIVGLVVGDGNVGSSGEAEGAGSVVKREVGVGGNVGGTLEPDEDVVRTLVAASDSLDGDVVATRSRDAVRDLPEALRTSSKTVSADLSDLAAVDVVGGLLVGPVDLEGTIADVGDLNDDLVTSIVVGLRDIDLVVVVELVSDELEGLSVGDKTITDDVGSDKRGSDVVDLDGVTDGGLEEGRVRGGVLETDDGKVVDAIGKVARGDGDLAPVLSGLVKGSASLDKVVARAEASKVVEVVVDLDRSVLDVVDEEGDVVTSLGVLNSERVVLDLTGLDVSSEGLISTEGGDGVDEGGGQGELDRNIIELVDVTVDRDVVAAGLELASLDLPRARRLSLATEALEELVALVLTGTGVLVEESSDGILVAVGVEINEEISVGDSLRDLDEEVLVTTKSGTAVDRDSRDELGVTDLDDAGRDGVATGEDGIEVSLDSNKVIIISPLASGDDDGVVAGSNNVGGTTVVEAAVSSNASTVDKDVDGVTKVVVLGEELAVLCVGDLDDEIVVGDGLGSNLVVGVLVGAVPLGDLVGDKLTGDEGLDDGGVVDGGSEGVTDGGGVLDKILVDTEDGDIPDSRTEVAGGDEDGAASVDDLGVGNEVGLSGGNDVSARRSDGTSAVVKVVVARAVSGEEVVVDKGLEGLGNSVLDVGDLDGEVLTLDGVVGADVVVVVLALEDVLRVRDGALDREGDVKVSIEGVVDGHLVVGVVTIGSVTDAVTVH